jgi:tetratricopeptide (TPR) repeat protein
MELSELKNKLATALSESDIENLGRLSEEAMQLYPNEGFGYYYFGEKLLNEAALDMPAVEWAFAKASFLEQDNINYLKKYAQSLEDLLKFEEAGNVFASIYNINPDDQEALYGLGKYELSDERKNYSNAIYYFSKIENPSAAVYHGLALAYMGLEESDNALGMIDYALSLEFDIEAAITKIQILEKNQQFILVPSVYEEILEAEPNNFGFVYEYAVALNRAKEFEKADSSFKKAFSLLPDDYPFDISIQSPFAQNCLEIGYYQEAADILKKCIANDENNDIYLKELLAKAKVGLKDFKGALSDLDEIINLYSYNPLLQQISELGKAELLISIGDFEAAEKAYDKLEKDLEKLESQAIGILQDVAYGKAVLYLASSDESKALSYAVKSYEMGSTKALDLIKTRLLSFILERRKTILENNSAGISANISNSLLQKVIGKTWVFNQLKLNTPPQFANDPEMIKQFEDSVDNFQSTLPEFVMFIGEKEIYLNIPFSNPEKPVRSMVYAYKVEKEKDNLLQIKMYSIDGIDEFSAKLKVDTNSIIFSINEGEVYRLNVIQDLNKISYKIQRNFVKSFGYLDILNKFGLDKNESAVIEALLDY